jgi:cation transport ATPase
MKRIHTAVRVAQTFSIPLGAGTAILLGLLITYVGHAPTIAVYVYLSAILFGSYGLIKDTIQAIRVGNFALDYIALLAITVGVLSGHYLVATVIVLMLSGGEALEDYSLQKAQSSLARLANRLPHKVYLWQDGALSHPVSIDEVSVGAIIAVRKGEVIPLDGTLLSPPLVLVDESSLTGEAFPVDKKTRRTHTQRYREYHHYAHHASHQRCGRFDLSENHTNGRSCSSGESSLDQAC